jgi:acyl carrier protein
MRYFSLMSEVFDKLKAFIIKEAGVKENEVIPEAKLEADLGVYGDDAIDLLLAYSKVFNVDVSQFKAADYVGPEGDIVLMAIESLFGKEKDRKDITINDLQKGIIAGRLDEDVMNS